MLKQNERPGDVQEREPQSGRDGLQEFIGSQADRYLTTQHERDPETGLDYRWARFYDSDLGRFLSVDPLASQFVAWSPYNYVLGNPVRLADPDGRAPSEPPVNGLEFFADDTGTYYWNGENESYDHFDIDDEGYTVVSQYRADEFKEPVGNYTIMFDLSGEKAPDQYTEEHTITTIAGSIMASLASDDKPWENISDQERYPGVLMFSHENMNGAITLGNMILTNPRMEGANTLDHEYGHYLDFKHHFKYDKSAYLREIGVPSIISATKATISPEDYEHHESIPERRADRLGGAWGNNTRLMNQFR